MSQDESELKEFFIVMSKLKQKALLAKLLSVGLVAISGLMVAGSIGYMIYEVESLKSDLNDCEESKTASINAVQNSNISESQKNQILELENTERLPSNDNTINDGNGGQGIQNKNRPILPNPSPRKPTATGSPKPDVKPTSEPSPIPSPTATDSTNRKGNKGDDIQPKPPTNNSQSANKDTPILNPNKNCEEIIRSFESAKKLKNEVEVRKLGEQYKNCKTNKPR